MMGDFFFIVILFLSFFLSRHEELAVSQKLLAGSNLLLPWVLSLLS